MGLIRGGLVSVVSILLFLSLFAGNSFLTLKWSLEYETIQPELASVVKQVIDEQGFNAKLEESFPLMELYCQENSDYVFSYEDITIVIPCNVINEGSDAVLDYGINSVIEQFYYKEYDCSFWKCIKDSEQPYVLVSEKAKDYWGGKFYTTLVISLVLAVILFFLVEQKYKMFITTGVLIIVSSLPFMKLKWLLSIVANISYLEFFTSFFTKAYNVFLIMCILGIVVLALGIALKFGFLGIQFSDWLSKKKK